MGRLSELVSKKCAIGVLCSPADQCRGSREQGLVDDRDRLVAITTLQVTGRAGRELAAEVGEGGSERALAEVERDDRPRVGVERDEGRLLATGARAAADIDCETVALGVGDARATAYGCDLTQGYIDENAAYYSS